MLKHDRKIEKLLNIPSISSACTVSLETEKEEEEARWPHARPSN